MKDIIERLERATGPDRELDIAIENVLGLARWAPPHPFRAHMEGSTRKDPTTYTGSIDAALALVERMLPGWQWSRRYDGEVYLAKNGIVQSVGFCATTPLSILQALFRALQAEGE